MVVVGCLVLPDQTGSWEEGVVGTWLDVYAPRNLSLTPAHAPGDSRIGCAQNKSIQLQFQGQKGSKSLDKMPFPNYAYGPTLSGVCGGWGNGYLARCLQP